MGVFRVVVRASAVPAAVVAFSFLAGAGCQAAKGKEFTRKLIDSQVWVDFSGLKPAAAVDPVRVTCAAPRQWEVMPLNKGSIYTHLQWRSPSRRTGVGVAHLRMPLPLGEKAVIWFAKQEYTKKSDDGRLIGEWTDDLGRRWFEAENNRYHVKGYAVVSGFEAWVVYYGHKVEFPPDGLEISLAARAMNSIIPWVEGEAVGVSTPTTAEKQGPSVSTPVSPPDEGNPADAS